MKAFIPILIVALVHFSKEAAAQYALNEDCTIQELSCKSSADCTQPPITVPTEDCRRCLVPAPFPFGGKKCLSFGNDPSCEARKAAFRAQLEAQRATERARCELDARMVEKSCMIEAEKAALDCEATIAAANSSSGVGGLHATLLASKDRSRVRLPSHISQQIEKSGVYQDSLAMIRELEVVNIERGDKVPSYSSVDRPGFTIGTTIFVWDIDNINDIPLPFWLTQIEISRLYLDYGFEQFGQLFEENPVVFETLINSKVDRACKKIPC